MRFLVVTAFLSICALAIGAESKFIHPGQKAPDFKLNDPAMKVTELRSLRGRPVVIVYTGRDGFDDAAEIIKDIQREYNTANNGSDKAVVNNGKTHVVGAANLKGVPFFVKKKVKKHISKSQYPFFLMDWKGDIADAYGYDESGVSIFVVDSDGVVKFAGSVKDVKETRKSVYPAISGLISK